MFWSLRLFDSKSTFACGSIRGRGCFCSGGRGGGGGGGGRDVNRVFFRTLDSLAMAAVVVVVGFLLVVIVAVVDNDDDNPLAADDDNDGSGGGGGGHFFGCCLDGDDKTGYRCVGGGGNRDGGRLCLCCFKACSPPRDWYSGYWEPFDDTGRLRPHARRIKRRNLGGKAVVMFFRPVVSNVIVGNKPNATQQNDQIFGFVWNRVLVFCLCISLSISPSDSLSAARSQMHILKPGSSLKKGNTRTPRVLSLTRDGPSASFNRVVVLLCCCRSSCHHSPSRDQS